MATYRIDGVEEQASGDVHADTYVLNDADVVIGHFTVVLKADDVLALSGLTQAQRIAGYKALFEADPRITKTVDSESAVAQIEADLTFPITVTL